MDEAITLLAIVGLFLSCAGLIWIYYKGQAYRRLIRMWKREQERVSRMDRPRLVHRSQHAAIAKVDRPLVRVKVIVPRGGLFRGFGG